MATTMTKYVDLLPFIASRLPACPRELAKQALGTGAEEFFRVTEGWVHRCADIDIVADQRLYVLPMPVQGYVKRIVRVSISEHRVQSYAYTLDAFAKLRWEDHYIPTTAVPDGLSVDIAVVPAATVETIPTHILNRYRDALCQHALAELAAMQGMRWYNPVLAEKAAAAAARARNQVRVESARQGRSGPLVSAGPSIRGGDWGY